MLQRKSSSTAFTLPFTFLLLHCLYKKYFRLIFISRVCVIPLLFATTYYVAVKIAIKIILFRCWWLSLLLLWYVLNIQSSSTTGISYGMDDEQNQIDNNNKYDIFSILNFMHYFHHHVKIHSSSLENKW